MSLTLSEYAIIVPKFNVCPQLPSWLPEFKLPLYEAMGLAGEAGEALEKVKKGWRDGNFDRSGYLKELGDTLWYIAEGARKVGSTLEEVALMNIEKLESRLRRDQIHGEGDNR